MCQSQEIAQKSKKFRVFTFHMGAAMLTLLLTLTEYFARFLYLSVFWCTEKGLTLGGENSIGVMCSIITGLLCSIKWQTSRIYLVWNDLGFKRTILFQQLQLDSCQSTQIAKSSAIGSFVCQTKQKWCCEKIQIFMLFGRVNQENQ